MAAAHTQQATQNSDGGMLGGHLLATHGTRSSADGTVRALGLSAYSRPSTLLATRRCDLVKPAKGGSRLWALLQPHQEEARQSKTQRYDEGCLLHSSYLSGLEDLYLAMSSAHDHQPIWNFTCTQVASAVQQAAAETRLER